MATQHTTADDIVYNLISIQYHALKAAQVYDGYAEDARRDGHEDVAQFIEQCAQQDGDRARRCHELLYELTRHGLSGT
ncbi:MAG: acyl carrier protein [Frankiaceae bacterium]